jgi:hypothetical protein
MSIHNLVRELRLVRNKLIFCRKTGNQKMFDKTVARGATIVVQLDESYPDWRNFVDENFSIVGTYPEPGAKDNAND